MQALGRIASWDAEGFCSVHTNVYCGRVGADGKRYVITTAVGEELLLQKQEFEKLIPAVQHIPIANQTFQSTRRMINGSSVFGYLRDRRQLVSSGVTLQTDRKVGVVTKSTEVSRKDGWWNDAEVQQQHREKATNFIQTIPRYPGHFEGRGIVITGGGKYFVSAYITIRVIRHIGCTLPIELWHLDGEMDDEMIGMVAEHNGSCHNASELARGTNYFLDHWWKGWQLKAFALLHSSFREVLMLDADSYPTKDPSFVFEWTPYKETGSIIWPDVGDSARLFPPLAAKVLGVPQFTEGAAESGQLVFNKEQTWKGLNLAKHYNADADYIYHIVYGDKDTFPAAMHRVGSPYSRMNPNCKMNGPGIQQLDQNGDVLFNHRIHDKFRIFNTRFDSTAQRGATQQRASGWRHENFCHRVLQELNERWANNERA